MDCAIHVLQNEQEDGPEPVATTDRGVFIMRSSSRAGVEYRQDVFANNGAGWCSCPDFGVRRQANLDAGMPSWMPETTCPHLRRLMRYGWRRVCEDGAKAEAGRR